MTPPVLEGLGRPGKHIKSDPQQHTITSALPTADRRGRATEPRNPSTKPAPPSPARAQDTRQSDEMAAVLLSAAPFSSAAASRIVRRSNNGGAHPGATRAHSAVARRAASSSSSSSGGKVKLLAATLSTSLTAALVALPAFAEEATASASASAEISPFAGRVSNVYNTHFSYFFCSQLGTFCEMSY